MTQHLFRSIGLMIGLSVIAQAWPVVAQTRRPQFELDASPGQTPTSQVFVEQPKNVDEAFGRCQQDQVQDLDANEYFRLLASEESVGTTVEAYPTVLAYVPPTSASHISVTIKRLRDGLNLYQSTMRIRPKALNAIRYPDYLAPLEAGEQYLWSVSLLCESVVLSYNPVDQLILKRQSPNLLPEELTDPLASQRAQSLGEMGVWHDMISRLYYEAVDRRSTVAKKQLKALISALGIPVEE